MNAETMKRIERAIESVRASKDGCGQVVISIVKGRVTHIRKSDIEAVVEEESSKIKTQISKTQIKI